MKPIALKKVLTTLFNIALTCSLIYGIVIAISSEESLWAIGYLASLITQILHIINSHKGNNKARGGKNDGT